MQMLNLALEQNPEIKIAQANLVAAQERLPTESGGFAAQCRLGCNAQPRPQ